jgi:hypothetical protein
MSSSSFLTRNGQATGQANNTPTDRVPETKFPRIPDKGFAFHDALRSLSPSGGKGRIPRRPDHNLLRRLRDRVRDRNSDVLRFLSEPSVPFASNRAERVTDLGANMRMED